MIYVVTGLVLVGATTLVNLLLTFAVIRRLRENAATATSQPGPDFTGAVPVAGDRPEPFVAYDLDGTVLDDAANPATLIGFFSTGCGACVEQLPTFVRQAADSPGGRARTVAVVQGDGGQADDFVRELAPVARVVVETGSGPVSTAFRIGAFPAWCLLDADGTVRDSGVGLDRLPRLTAA
ncbi:TlpA family protein disulfide reductase [Micromonospora sp. PLK6-60]|uniref:TlpA disulfide reductase family protein n=1 Tax=Micromonospora sp. PLK6-60 TaxID=2873383 RepID=UPI001CA751C5|nr:TlpA disulfide reductase family protein [Micromonospora sp. PLK6-60]MBY8872675.1 TlpA family protein disulfide reductase [Micromonospora sp. PLK6-60]